MSDADADAAEIVALFDSLYIQNLCLAASSVLFIHEVFITFDREVASYWTAKQTGASLLFFANRWISITCAVMTLVAFGSFPSDKSCSMFQIALTAFLILQFIPGAVFSALRAFVLSRSKLLGLFVLALSLAPVAANLAFYGYNLSGENFPPFGCEQTLDITEASNLRSVVIISRVPLIVADILLIYITWTKLSTHNAFSNAKHLQGISLSDVFIRNGTIYFVVLFCLNVLHLVLSIAAVGGVGITVTIFTAPITAILVSRFLLVLQEANQVDVRLDPDHPLYSSRDPYSTLGFISSLGGFINPDVSAMSDLDFEMQADSHTERQEESGTEVTQVAASSSSA